VSELRVTRLSVTPVKGLALHHPDAIELTPDGAAGDREFHLIDARDRLISLTKIGALLGARGEYDPALDRLTLRLADGARVSDEVRLGAPVATDFWGKRVVPGHVLEGPWTAALSELAGRSVRLVRAARLAYDYHPVTLLGEASVAELARRSGLASVDARRFRMLIEFAGAPAHAEDGWDGRALRAGEALLRVGGPVPRCAATTRNPDRGERDLATVKLIKAYRGLQESEDGLTANFGVYAEVLEPGAVRVGDALV